MEDAIYVGLYNVCAYHCNGENLRNLSAYQTHKTIFTIHQSNEVGTYFALIDTRYLNACVSAIPNALKA